MYLRSYGHAQQHLAICLAFHRQTSDQLEGTLLGGTVEEDMPLLRCVESC